MEPSQEVDIPLEKGNTYVESEKDSGEDSNLEDSKIVGSTMESTEIHWKTNGKSISTVHVPKKRLPHHLHSSFSGISEDAVKVSSNVFTFSNESINQESKEDFCCEITPIQSLSISTHLIHSPREKRKTPSSPVHNRVRATRPQLSVGPSTIKLKAVSFRRNRPSVSASWIQPKAGTIRNSWSSRNQAVPPVTVVTCYSAGCSPRLDTSDNSLDIVIKPPPRYVSHRFKLNELNSINIPFPHFEKEPLEIEPCSPFALSRTQSTSPFDRDSFNTSLMAESPLPPYTSTARLLNVSHDLTPDDLQPPTESIYINVSSSRRPVLSILPSISPITTTIVGDNPLVTELSSYHSDDDSDPSELNRLDFSQLKYSDKPITKSGEITEDMTETITALMNERNEDRNEGWKGEELEGGQVSSEDDLIDGTYFGHFHRSIETIVSPLSVDLPPSDPGHLSPVPTPIISREASPLPLPLSEDLEEVESFPSEEEKTPEPPPPSFDVMSMDIDQMLSLSSPPFITSSSLPPSPLPPPVSPPPVVSVPFQEPVPVPEFVSTPPVEKKIYLPTDVQIQLVDTLNAERSKRYKEREEEEERRKQELMKKALQERNELIEERNRHVKENLQKRETMKQVSFRNDEFSYLFGDCSFLLLPYIYILDYIFGPILKPSDDLIHLEEVFINYVNKGDLDSSPFAKRVVKSHYLSSRAQMVWEVKQNPYLQSFFKNFAFYYQCALNYTYKKITCYI